MFHVDMDHLHSLLYAGQCI